MKKFRLLTVAIFFALILVLAACGSDNNNDNNNNGEAANDNDNNVENNDNGNADGDIELGDKDITVAYIAWAGALARTPVLKQLLEEAGYNVEDSQLEAGPAWQAVADDPSTFISAAWLPATHAEYWDQYEDDVDEIGVFVDEAPLALTVPDYVVDEYGIEEMDDLVDNEEFGDDVDWTITGIDPGAGIMNNTETALDEYDLADAGWTLQESSESAMLAELMEKYDNEEPIIIPGWKPHQMFADMDLTMLEDPEEVYGGAGDEIAAVGNKDFEETHPAAYEIIKRFTEDYDTDLENDLLVKINIDDEDADQVAEDYLEENSDKVDEWLDGIATE